MKNFPPRFKELLLPFRQDRSPAAARMIADNPAMLSIFDVWNPLFIDNVILDGDPPDDVDERRRWLWRSASLNKHRIAAAAGPKHEAQALYDLIDSAQIYPDGTVNEACFRKVYAFATGCHLRDVPPRTPGIIRRAVEKMRRAAG